MAVPGTLGSVALALAGLVQPIQERFGPGGPRGIAAELGLRLPASIDTNAGLVDASNRAQQNLRAIPDLVTDLIGATDDVVIADKAVRLATSVGLAVDALATVGSALRTAATGSGVPAAELDAFAAAFPQRVLDLLVVTAAESRSGIGEALEFIGAIERTDVAAGDAQHPAFLRRTLQLDKLTAFLASPANALKARYGWGAPDFTGTALLAAAAKVLRRLGLPVVEDDNGAVPVLDILFLEVEPQDGGLAVDVLYPVPAVPITQFDGGDWKATIHVQLPLPVGARLLLRPDDSVTVSVPGGAQVEGSVTVEITAVRADGTPHVLIGEPGGSRLEAKELTATAGLSLGFDPSAAHAVGEFTLGGEVKGLKLVIDASDGDGFLAKILGGAHLEAGFDLSFTVDSEHGVQLGGSGGLDVQVPVHIGLGPIELQQIYLALRFVDGTVPVELSAGFSAALGPVRASVERMGALVELSFPDGGGNAGPAQLDFAFKPPTGAGLVVDAGLVAGGGFLSFDPDRGEYAGALELEFAGFVAVKAIGLITTRMPDGSQGFSLLIVLTAEFGSGIQLGFGFTLLGVGGILGLNRRMDLGALVEGVVSGSIESVMFPKDVVANAPRILSDLKKFFPPEEGRFLVGPMAKIGWGTPTLVTVSLGLIVEIPPGDIAILGVLRCVLPSDDVRLLVLQVDFVGALEVDKSRLWFFATLFDSRILTMTIEGGMGLLVDWSGNPDFVLTVGGFHPSFKPPPLPFPVPARLSVDILNSPGRLIRVSGYFAVTSNTVQFGAKAELRLGFGDFGIEGHLAFDALFRFSPFTFVIRISAGVSLKAFGVGVFGIDLDFTLEGPAPWRAHGRGSISLLFFEISADFDITWGQARTTTLPPVEVLALLETEVRKTDGWQTRLPAGGANPLVTLRQLTEGDTLVLHPLGTLFLHQRVIPLDVRIDRIGAQRPSDGKRFSVSPQPGSGLVQVSLTSDQFAMAQFQDMDDAAKLSRPAYETQDAGLELTAANGAIASPRVVRRSARFELHVIDSHPPNPPNLANGAPTRSKSRLYRPHPAVFDQLLAGSSTARSPLSQREAQLRQPFATQETVQLTGGRFVVAYKRNNLQAFPPATASSTTANFRSVATAEDAIEDWTRADPALAGQLQVLPQGEASDEVPVQRGTWSGARSPATAVSTVDAVRLAGGKVLVAGGVDATGTVVADTAVFDPVAVTWAGTGALSTARAGHTTTRLGDGRVVAVGGLGAGGAPLASAEVYDPVAGTWRTAEDTLHTARSGHSAVVVGGQLLVAGGTDVRGAALDSAELLDPATLRWTEIAPMSSARTGHQVVPFGGGAKVLVVGGAMPTGDGERALALCEVYDRATKTWSATGSLGTARKGHQATLLADGRVLVTGGDAVQTVPYRPDSLAATELFDPDSGKWTPGPDMPGGGRSGHRCLPTPAGVVVVGGFGRPQATAGFRDAAVFDAGSGTWATSGALATGRWDFPAVVLADGRVLVAGGRALAGLAAPGPALAVMAATAELYLP